MLTCTVCLLEKDNSEFYKNSRKNSGFDTHCKSCRRLKAKIYRANMSPEMKSKRYSERLDWIANNIEKVRCQAKLRARKRTKLIADTVFEEYGNRCQCCGVTERTFLMFDHINNDGNTHRKELGGRGGYHLYRTLVKEGFPKDRVQILCANCNHSKRMNDGICIHKISN